MTAPVRTKSFRDRHGEVVRLPEGVGFGAGTELEVARDGDRIVLTPVRDTAAKGRELRELLDALAALPAPSYVQRRGLVDFPERFGR